MLDAAHNLEEFLTGIEYSAFVTDKLRYYAVLKNIEIVGEAAYMLSTSFKTSHPELPWDKMIKMRHVLVHGYASVLPEMLWQTAIQEIPEIKPIIENIYNAV